jgi:hypothetical protein
MRAAAHGVWVQAQNTTMPRGPRPHPGRQPAQLRAGAAGRALGPGGPILDDLDTAVRDEAIRLADGVNPEILDQIQRDWRRRGFAPAADAAGLLATYAAHLRQRAVELGAPTGTQQTIRVGSNPDPADRRNRQPTTTVPVRSLDQGLLIAAAAAETAAHTARTAPTTIGPTPNPGDPIAAMPDDLGDLHQAQSHRLGGAFPPLTTVVQQTVPHLADKDPAAVVSRQKGTAR